MRDELQARLELLRKEWETGRTRLADQHKRQLRRYRTDELRAGLEVVAGAYRDQLADRTAHDPVAAVAAVTAVHEAIEALDRNVNETLLLQALLLRLPAA